MRDELQVIDLEIAEIKAGIEDGTILLVDVREDHEYAMGHIPGAVLLPLSRFDPARVPQEAGKRTVFSCAAGVRSIQALAIAQGAGLDITEHYRGGFREWAMMGEPVEA
jgi:rhodanese-related sulfurtransferase